MVRCAAETEVGAVEYADFWWNGHLASAMGLVVTEQVSYQRPAERVEEIVIPFP